MVESYKYIFLPLSEPILLGMLEKKKKSVITTSSVTVTLLTDHPTLIDQLEQEF